MDVTEVKERVRGPLAPVLTVYREGDLALDLDAIQENVDQQIRRGMTTGNGVLLAAGAGGDFPLLSFEERKTVIQAVLANVWPEHEVALWKRFAAGEYGQATEEFLRVNWPWRNLRVWAHAEIAGGESLLVKPAAEMTGFHGGPTRPPMMDLDATQGARVRAVLEQIGSPLV